MSIEYEDRIIREHAEEEKMSRLWNRKNERKYRKRKMRLLNRKGYVYWGFAAEGRGGKKYIKYSSRNGWKREMKRKNHKKMRKEEDIPDGNGYRKYTERWKYE